LHEHANAPAQEQTRIELQGLVGKFASGGERFQIVVLEDNGTAQAL
jgi:hypothetical protein